MYTVLINGLPIRVEKLQVVLDILETLGEELDD